MVEEAAMALLEHETLSEALGSIERDISDISFSTITHVGLDKLAC